MRQAGLLIIVCLISTNLNAQKWAFRLGFHNLKSYSTVNVTQINDQRGDVRIHTDRHSTPIIVGNMLYMVPRLSNFWDFTITYNFLPKHGVMVGTRVISPYMYSTISNDFGNRLHAEGITTPVIRFNYTNTVWQSKKENPSCFSLLAGLALNFSPRGGSFGSGGWYGATGAVDSSGTFYYEYRQAKIVRGYGSKYPLPYLNIGIDGALRLSKRWKMGMEFAFYAGTKTLYTQEIEGSTNDANFAYTLKLKPYFFSGGIYFQYRIK